LDKPNAIKGIQIIVWIQLGLSALTIGLFAITALNSSSERLLYEFSNSLLNGYLGSETDHLDGQMISRILGQLLFPVLVNVFLLIFINKCMAKSTIVLMALKVIFSLGSIIGLVINAAMLFTAWHNKDSKRYFGFSKPGVSKSMQ
jgi:hypothetical protein